MSEALTAIGPLLGSGRTGLIYAAAWGLCCLFFLGLLIFMLVSEHREKRGRR